MTTSSSSINATITGTVPSTAAHTRTGGLPIGFRLGSSAWQKDLASLAQWASQHAFAGVDVCEPGQIGPVLAAGLAVGTVDLPFWKQPLITADAARRQAMLALYQEWIGRAVEAGARQFFTIMLPDDKAMSRADSFRYMVEAYAALLPELERLAVQVCIEGWPGPGAQCCTPETIRAFFRELPSPALAINYDPSHLLRMGIDPLRFVDEFAPRIAHVHAKDTAINPDRLYDLGTEQPPTFAASVPWGGNAWRYTLPGHGLMHWTEAFQRLANAGYRGLVCIELEDMNFNGSTAGEQQGLDITRRYLQGC